ncbi:MAG: energy transducer TonB [Bacteroidota bacterium]
MKHSHSFLFICLMIVNTFALAQNTIVIGSPSKNNSLEYYNQGLSYMGKQQYKEADSLFTLSVDMLPHPDTYFNLALTKYHLKDICGYCEMLKNAVELKDYESGIYYLKNCKKSEKIQHSNPISTDTILSSIIITDVCKHENKQQFCIKDKKNKKITSFYLAEKDRQKLFDTNIFPDSAETKINIVVCDEVDEMPHYMGGEDNLMNFLDFYIKYPEKDKESEYQGTVSLKFIVDVTGKIDSVEAFNYKSEKYSNDVVRAFKMMPKWIPALKDGKATKVHFQMAISEINIIHKNRIISENYDVLPEYQGGEGGRAQFLTNSIKYPQFAKEHGQQGTVYIQVIIDETGKMVSAFALKGVSKDIDEETLRVVRLMPKWKPGIKDNKAICCKVVFPVKYTLTD